MEKLKEASFKLESFRFKKFSYSGIDFIPEKYTLRLHPSGKYSSTNGKYTLEFNFSTFKDSDLSSAIVEVTMISDFVFETGIKLEEIPSYFYRNSIAIVFPYLRSLVSTLTLLSNSTPLILPIMNLSGLEKELIENTVEVEL